MNYSISFPKITKICIIFGAPICAVDLQHFPKYYRMIVVLAEGGLFLHVHGAYFFHDSLFH